MEIHLKSWETGGCSISSIHTCIMIQLKIRLKQASEYDQEIPQSQTNDQPTSP